MQLQSQANGGVLEGKGGLAFTSLSCGSQAVHLSPSSFLASPGAATFYRSHPRIHVHTIHAINHTPPFQEVPAL